MNQSTSASNPRTLAHAQPRELAHVDPDLAAAIAGERRRQQDYLELIASENYASPGVLEAQGSVLTNKYADGMPGKRSYRGCEWVDVVETLAIERAKRLFGAAYANVQPYSGSLANAAALLALLEPGDTVLCMDPAQGGHRTHGSPDHLSGSLYKAVYYGVNPATGIIDYDAVGELARRHQPKLIVAGFSAYSRVLDWRRFREIADGVGACFLADMAHVAGFVATGLYPSPVAIADVTTTTTHKTLRGPRGGLILARENADLTRRLDAAVYPGTQGGPLMHVIAGKAAAFREALEPAFVDYQRAVLANARRLSERLASRGYEVIAGGTDNHMVLILLPGERTSGTEAEAALEQAHIAVNAMRFPTQPGVANNAGSASPASDGDLRFGDGLRLGTPAITTRGFGLGETEAVADLVADVLDEPASQTVIARVADQVKALCGAFPIDPDA